MAKSVAVIGAGVAGIQAAQQLTDLGLTVHLVEKEAIIGGLSSYLGRVFPTGDCALCLDASCEIFDGMHRRCQYRSLITSKKSLKLHTQTTVTAIEKASDVYSVSIEKTPRYVDLDKCVVCLECINVCEEEMEDEYGIRGSTRKVIYRPIPQGVPLAPVIDMEKCTKCGKCVEVCHVNAIDLEEKPKKQTLKVDAIILATGVDERAPVDMPGYSYSLSNDVLTQRELARLIDPAGPTSGNVVTASGDAAQSVTMILCAGSRDLNAAPYCSQACCTYSLKHAVMLREKNIDVTICYMDIRVPFSSKHYFEEAKAAGVNFLRGKPDHIKTRNGKPFVTLEDTIKRKRKEFSTDLVVLAAALTPHATMHEQLKEYTQGYGFSERMTGTERVYACGTSTGPADIPTSVAEANAVAMQVYLELEGGA